MKESRETLPHSSPCQFLSGPSPRSKENRRAFVRIVEPSAKPRALAAAKRGRPPGVKLRCECSHAKSIHARMYANPKLGTSCNYPGCRCKAYKAGSASGKRKRGR
jgi:hypothetical protein